MKTTKTKTTTSETKEKPKYVAFPVEHFRLVLERLNLSTERISYDKDVSLVQMGCEIGTMRETVFELARAVRKAEESFVPNKRDNPHGVVLIRDMAPIV